jgi:beta-lactamase class A
MVVASALMSHVEEIAGEFSGRVSVSASNLVTGERLDMREGEVFPALSAIKLGIMAELFFQIEEEGKIALTDKVTINQSDLRLGTGVFREFETPFEITVKDVCMMMIVVSDNTCTWLLTDLVGKARINARMRSLGLNEYSLNSDLGADTFDELAGKDIDAYSECSSRDFTGLVTRIANGELVSASASAQMLDIMGRCQHIEWLGRYLPLNQFPAEAGIEPVYKLYNKLGAYLHGRCDTGLITGPDLRYVITVMTADSKDPTAMLCEHEGSRTIGRISKAVFDAWTKSGTRSGPNAG